MRIARSLVFAGLFGVLALPAFAQDANDLEARIRAQRERLEVLEKQMEDLRAGQAKASAARKSEKEKQKTLLTLEYSNGFKMYYKDPASGKKRFALQIKGRLQMDGQVRLDGSDRKHGSSTLNTFKERRVRLQVKGTLYSYWHFVLTLALEKGDSAVLADQDSFIENDYIKQAKMRIGQFKAPFSLEELTSSKQVRPIERSMAVNFIAPGHQLGFMVHGSLARKVFNYYVMVANGNGDARTDNHDGKSGYARIVLKPFAASKDSPMAGLQLGGSVGYGIHDRASPGTVHGSRVSTGPGTRLITYASGAVVDGEVFRWGADFQYTIGSFGVRGEYLEMREELSRRTSLDELVLVDRQDVRWSGGHIGFGYFLTGEKQTFGRPKVLKIMEPGQPDSGSGAWEIIGRYGWIENHRPEGDLQGFYLTAHQPSRIHQTFLGVNWYPNPMVKIALQWQHAWWNRAIKDADAIIKVGVSRPKHQDTLMMRVQLEF